MEELFEALYWITGLVALPVLLFAAMHCLTVCQGKRRSWLGGCMALTAAALVLLSGGGSLWKGLGMTWRNGPALTLCALALAGAVGTTVLTLTCLLPSRMPGMPAALRGAIKIGAVLCAGLALTIGLGYGAIVSGLVYGDREWVVEEQGQRMVKVSAWDGVYDFYPYHGPLVRGTEPIVLRWSDPQEENQK